MLNTFGYIYLILTRKDYRYVVIRHCYNSILNVEFLQANGPLKSGNDFHRPLYNNATCTCII